MTNGFSGAALLELCWAGAPSEIGIIMRSSLHDIIQVIGLYIPTWSPNSTSIFEGQPSKPKAFSNKDKGALCRLQGIFAVSIPHFYKPLEAGWSIQAQLIGFRHWNGIRSFTRGNSVSATIPLKGIYAIHFPRYILGAGLPKLSLDFKMFLDSPHYIGPRMGSLPTWGGNETRHMHGNFEGFPF